MQCDVVLGIQSDAMDPMITQILGDAASLGSYADDASLLHDIQYNEEQNKEAYSSVYKLISDQEGGNTLDPDWKPKKTGLHLTAAPPGKGPSMWVSPDGIEQFQMYGEDAIKRIGGSSRGRS